MRHRRLFESLVVAALSGAASARAQSANTAEPSGPRATLEWTLESPSDCITREQFVARTAEEAGRPVFVDEPADVAISVELGRVYDPDGWRARVTAKAPDGRVIGTREITHAGDSCALGDKLALIVALMVDPGLGATPAGAEPEERPEPGETPGPAHPTASPVLPVDEGPVYLAPSLQQPTPPPLHAAIDAFGVAGIGMLPDVAAGAQIGATVDPPWFWAFRLSATAFLDQTRALSPGQGRFRVMYGELGLCPIADAEDGPTWARVCGGIGAGPFWVESSGLAPSRHTVTMVFQTSVTANVGLRVAKRWYVVALAEGAIPILPNRYVIQQPDGSERSVFRMSGATVALGAGVGVQLK